MFKFNSARYVMMFPSVLIGFHIVILDRFSYQIVWASDGTISPLMPIERQFWFPVGWKL